MFSALTKQTLVTRLRSLLRWTGGLSVPARYIGATVVVGVAALVEWLSWPLLASRPYFLFVVAVMVVALVFNRMTGFYAWALSCSTLFLAFSEPDLSLPTLAQVVPFAIFAISSLVVVIIGEGFRLLADALNDGDEQKAVLLRELRHRTRNHLQMIAATVHMEAAGTAHDEAKECLCRTSQRIAGMGQISMALDSPSEGGAFDAHEFFEGLVNHIIPLASPRNITVECRAEPALVSRSTAELLGIATNELLMNALKYAFPDDRSGSVLVELTRNRAGWLNLIVSDNGVGCPAPNSVGTGLSLLSALVRISQGTIEMQNSFPGCKVTVRIQESACTDA